MMERIVKLPPVAFWTLAAGRPRPEIRYRDGVEVFERDGVLYQCDASGYEISSKDEERLKD
jgi:hypothetical protein